MKPVEPIPLNDPQRLHFEVILASLEKALARLEQIAQGTAAAGCRLTPMDDDLPGAFWEDAAPLVERVRARIAALTGAMALKERHSSSKRLARAMLTSQIVKLEDSSSSRLRGYGAVDPVVEQRLDPLLTQLQMDLHDILDLMSVPARDGQRSDAR